MQDVEIFYRKNRGRYVKIIASRIGYDFSSAEDIVQEAFYRAIKFKDSYSSSRAPYKTWFNKILFNALRDFQRQSKGYSLPLDDNLSIFDVLDTRLIRDPILVKHMFERVHEVENEKHRRILELFFITGYTSTEISQIESGVSVSNVTTVVSRFRNSLVEELKWNQLR